MKQWFVRHCIPGNEGEWSLRDEKNTRWALWLTSLHPWVSRPLFKEDKPRWSPVITLGSEKKPKSRKTKASGAHGQSAREVRAGQTENARDLQRLPLVDSAEKWPAGVREQRTWSWKTHSKGLEGTLPALTQDQELCLFPSARLESLKMHGTMGRIISTDFAWKGKMSSGLVLL